MGYTYKENGLEIRNTTNYHLCLFYHLYCEKNKVYIDEEVIKSQIEIFSWLW